MIRAVLLDLDDTLLDTRHSATTALAATCALAAERCPGLSEEQLRAAYHAVVREVDLELAARKIDFSQMRDFYLHRWTEILARCGLASEHAAALGERYMASRRLNYQLCEEVLELLPQLLDRYQVALLTNGPSDLQRDKIAIVDLERWLPRIYVSGELGCWKPQPAIFQHVLEQLGCAPREAVMVGDSLTNDVAGAAAVGMRTVWINRHGQRPVLAIRPDATVTDLRPLPGLLEEWCEDERQGWED
jgi:putative hydrolase of the HAD superfamily